MSRTDPLTDVPIMRLQPMGTGTVITKKSWRGTTDKMQTLLDLVRDAPIPEERGRIVFQERPFWDQFLTDYSGLTDRSVSRRKRLERVHALVHRAIRYEWEDQEIFEAGSHVWVRGKGDCEDQGEVVASLVEAMSADARANREPAFGWHLLAIGGAFDDPEHVTTLVSDAPPKDYALPVWAKNDYVAPEGWYFAETTIAAAFGENPYVAADRLGITDRPELQQRAA